MGNARRSCRCTGLSVQMSWVEPLAEAANFEHVRCSRDWGDGGRGGGRSRRPGIFSQILAMHLHSGVKRCLMRCHSQRLSGDASSTRCIARAVGKTYVLQCRHPGQDPDVTKCHPKREAGYMPGSLLLLPMWPRPRRSLLSWPICCSINGSGVTCPHCNSKRPQQQQSQTEQIIVS